MTTGVPSPASDAEKLATIDKFFNPASIAIVGATERAGYGSRFVSTLQRTGYAGTIYPINPGRPEVFGLPCFASPSALPETPDLAAIIVPAERVLESVRQCAEIGVRGSAHSRRSAASRATNPPS